MIKAPLPSEVMKLSNMTGDGLMATRRKLIRYQCHEQIKKATTIEEVREVVEVMLFGKELTCSDNT